MGVNSRSPTPGCRRRTSVSRSTFETLYGEEETSGGSWDLLKKPSAITPQGNHRTRTKPGEEASPEAIFRAPFRPTPGNPTILRAP